MKNIRAVPILISLLLLLSCEDFFGRYDPVEESGYVFELKDFSFYQWSASNNSNVLKIDSYGMIDRDKREVSLTLPPSFNFSSTILTASAGAENIGMGNDSTYYWFEIFDSTWKSSQKMKLTKELVNYYGDEETYYDLEYDINIKKELLASIEAILTDSYSSVYPYNYLFTNNPLMKVSFNDAVNAGSLSDTDFTASYSLSSTITPLSTYEYQIAPAGAALAVGNYSIKLNSDSCNATSAGYSNSASNTYTFAVDLASPTISNGTLTLTPAGNWTPASLPAFILAVSYINATDDLTPTASLQYKLCYSTTYLGGTSYVSNLNTMYYSPYFIPVDGKEWFSYVSPISKTFDQLPAIFQNEMISYATNTFYLNLIVRDNSRLDSHSSMYSYTTNSYTRP
ncbi:MAG: hypothetical protein JXA95_09690 [Spirochaetales bacterium]|nr:hypothetical protein [Spirochaetales bacterium]